MINMRHDQYPYECIWKHNEFLSSYMFQIINSLRMVQEYVENQKPSLQPAMIPIKTVHLTLLVMHLANEEDIEK